LIKREALVKSATLVFFEEFNGASRGQKPKKRGKSKGQGSGANVVFGWIKKSVLFSLLLTISAIT